MKKVLYIESSPRKDRSHSINVANKYMEKMKASGNLDIKKINLWDYDLPEFDGDMLNAKYAAIAGTDASAEENNAWAQALFSSALASVPAIAAYLAFSISPSNSGRS